MKTIVQVMRLLALTVIGVVCIAGAASAAPASPGLNVVPVRGQGQQVYYLPAQGTAQRRSVLYLPGIGGWEGFGVRIAETIASWGYDVYGLDTKTYLDSFTTPSSRLSERDVMRDLRTLGEWAKAQSGTPLTLIGWSEGAGLTVLAASAGEGKQTFNGLVTFGLGDRNVIAWHWTENVTSLFRKPHEPEFSAAGYMAGVAPLPFMMIQSSRDQFVTTDEARRLFDAAREPKRFELVQADNHRFDGNHDEFFMRLRTGLDWIAASPDPGMRTRP